MASVALSLLFLLLAACPARADTWRRPVDGQVLRAFTLGPNPYARGQHRGADLAATPGSRVRGACAGRVRFGGRVPRGGRTVSVRCGRLVATYQQLATITVRRGQRVPAGATLGTVGRSQDRYERRPHLHFGARIAATGRYVDPLTLLRGSLRAPPLTPAKRVRPPAPPARAPHSRLRQPDPRTRVPTLVPRSLPVRAIHHPDPGIPWTVWGGLCSIAAALQIGGLVRRGRRRRAAVAATRTA